MAQVRVKNFKSGKYYVSGCTPLANKCSRTEVEAPKTAQCKILRNSDGCPVLALQIVTREFEFFECVYLRFFKIGLWIPYRTK